MRGGGELHGWVGRGVAAFGAPIVGLVGILIAASPSLSQAVPPPSPIRPGDVVAANIRDSSVALFDGETGAFRGYVVAPSEGDLSNPTGIAFGPDGDLYVASSGNDRILRYDGTTGQPRGAFVEGPPLSQPFSLIFDPGGDLLVSSGSVVQRFDPQGNFLGQAARDTALVQPIGLALGSDGLLYVANSTARRIDRFDPATGGQVDAFAVDSLSFPSDVAFGPDGDLYVSSAAHRRVVRFDGRTGDFRGVVVSLPDGVPMGLAFGAAGRLFVGDFGGHRLFVVEAPAAAAEPPLLLSAEGLAGPENIAVKPGR